MMQHFQDTATGQIWAFDDDAVKITNTGDGYSFTTLAGVALTSVPPTLQPHTGVFPPPPTSGELWSAYQATARSALSDSDITMHRIAEAVILGLTTWTAADVIPWADYRRTLRTIVNTASGTPGTLPTKPPYPAGT